VSRFGSLRFRLLAGAALWIATALALSGVALDALFRRHVDNQFVTRMTGQVEEMVAVVRLGADGRPKLARPLSDPLFRRPYSGLYWQVQDTVGIAARSRSLWDTALELPTDPLADGALHRHRIDGPAGQKLIAFERAVLLPDASQPLRLVVATDERTVTALTRSFAAILAWSLSVLAVGLIAAAAAQVLGGLRPLGRLRRALSVIRAGGAERLDGRYPDEIQPLVDDLNTVLAHNQSMLARARREAGDLAHSLKTPLAVMANEAGALAARGETEPGERIRQQTALMRERIDYHLARARMAGTTALSGTATPVTPVLDAIARTMRQIHRELALDIAVAPVTAAVRVERQDLEEMIGNLADNACKWARGRVALGGEAAGTRVTILIDDDGPGLAADQRDRAFGRGVRLDERTPGSGLGLAIVRELAERCGGTVALENSPLGGLRARLDLPGSPAS
jgi:signal transduction histidine kinase